MYFPEAFTRAPLLQPPVVVNSATAVRVLWEELNCI